MADTQPPVNTSPAATTTGQTPRKRLSLEEGKRIRVNLLRLAGLAAVLAIVMEVILIVGGESTASLANLLNNGLWPFMVCMAVGIGQAIAGAWPARAAGFTAVAAPVAFIAAKVLQKGIATILDGSGADSAGPILTGSVLLEAVLRGLEYAVLAAGLAWIINQAWAGALAHAALGFTVGLVFGLIFLLFLQPDSFVGWTVEEIVFPTGCALVVFASETLKQLLPEELSGA
jgi:hypothetical protein